MRERTFAKRQAPGLTTPPALPTVGRERAGKFCGSVFVNLRFYGLRSMAYGLVSVVFPLAALLAQERAGIEKSNAPADRYIWAFEASAKGDDPASAVAQGTTAGQEGSGQARDGISPEAYDKVVRDNIKLRQDSAEFRKSLDETRKMNGDLVEKIRLLESAPQGGGTGGSSTPKAEKAAGTGGTGMALTTTLEENLTLQEQNRTLQTEVARLRNEVTRLQGEVPTGSTGATVSENSDLFKRLRQENALLAKELQRQKQAVRQTSEEGKKAEAANGDALKKAKRLEAENALLKKDNALLKKAVLALDSQAAKTGGVKDKLTASQNELEQKNRLLSEKEREIENQAGERDRLARAEKEAKEFGKEKSDLLFNLGVLYTKSGMYDDAIAAFRRVLETQAGAADAHFNLGVIFDKYLPDSKKASYHYRKCLELDPLNRDADKVKLWLLELEMDH